MTNSMSQITHVRIADLFLKRFVDTEIKTTITLEKKCGPKTLTIKTDYSLT